jgi:Concanavalin A-like lectin/glucanases superfamily/Domain of unknown function (DUF2341)
MTPAMLSIRMRPMRQLRDMRLLAIGIGLILLMSAGCSTERLAGGTIETTNGIVAGSVKETDGNAAARTLVRLLPENYDPIRDSGNIAVDTTDSKGRYSFAKVAAGRYNVYSVQGEKRTSALATGIQVAKDTVTVDTLVLKTPGSIEVLFGDNSFADGYIYLPGTGLATQLHGASRAFLDSVPSGLVADIRYAARASSPSTVLRYGITVTSGDTAVLANPGWKYAQALRLNTAGPDAGLSAEVTGFPVLVRLTQGNFDFSRAAADGRDLRFTNKRGLILPHEVESWDAGNQKAEIWVRMDTVRADDSTQSLLLYSGNAAAVSASRSEAVFDTAAGFQGVWHLGPSGTGLVPDATGNHFDGTAYGLTAANTVAGVAGSAKRFDGASSFIQILGSASGKLNFPEGGAYTLSAWVAVDSATTRPEAIVGKGHSQYYMRKNWYSGTTFWEAVEYRNAEKKLHICEARAVPLPTANVWKYIVAVSKGDKQSLYINGELAMDSTRLSPFAEGITVRDSGFDVTIGKHLQPTDVEGDCFLKGLIDEVRISNLAYGPDRIKLDYLNQKTDAHWVEFP